MKTEREERGSLRWEYLSISLPEKKSERSRPREMTRAWIRRRSLRLDDERAFEMEAGDTTIELTFARNSSFVI